MVVAATPPSAAEILEIGEPVVMRAAAVAETPQGFVGSTATITITAAGNGSGHIFLDTFPLTAVDMQGSARLAARVASQVTGKVLSSHDFFFVIRSGSEQIGGPSAGATMAVGAVAALNGWTVRPDVLMTGTIQPDGSVGPVGGIPEKAAAAAEAGITTFLFPRGEEITTLSRTGQNVNLTAYCRDQLGLSCVPVGDVIEAVNLMTDHEIVLPPVTGNVTSEDYLARLGPLSETLVDAAEALIVEAEAALETAPQGTTHAFLVDRLDAARLLIEAAHNASAGGAFYTAASRSFNASIEAHRVRDAARLISAADPRSELERILDVDAADVAAARAAVDAVKVDRVGLFEPVGAAQVRLLQAEASLASARSTARNATSATSILEAVYDGSYASERANTARWWLDLGRGFDLGPVIDAEGLAGLARDEITAAREQVAYVEAVFGASNVGASLGGARAKLEQAEEAFDRGYHAAAILTALEAEVDAGVILELAGFQGRVPQAKLDAAREAAARAIETARARGVEPFLAESEYEFGLSLPDAGDQLRFFGMARVTANLAGLPGAFGSAPAAVETRFQGLPEAYAPPAWIVGAFAVGMALGVGLGLLALLPREEDTEDAWIRRTRAEAGSELPPPPPT